MAQRRKSRSVAFQLVVAVVAVLAIAVPLSVGATEGGGEAFSDVPGSHPFADEIAWLESVEVTGGFPDGTYRPSQPVTRGSMAAFMQRLYDLQEQTVAVGSPTQLTISASGSFAPVSGAFLAMTVPEGAHALIIARFSAQTACQGSAFWCAARIMVSEAGGPYQEMAPGGGMNFAFDSAGTDAWEGHSMERFVQADAGTTYLFRVEAARFSDAITNYTLDDWTLVVESDLRPSGFVPA
jgi:hypothetical protein